MIDSFYLILLGSYRALYIPNWIVRAVGSEHHFDPISVIFGVIQTALYLDFAWVYWTRQRVKLRGGGIVDSDDLRKGWLVNRVLSGRRSGDHDEEEAPALQDDEDGVQNGHPKRQNRWGARGVSVSADDTLHDEPRSRRRGDADHGNTAEESQVMVENDDSLFSDEETGDDAEVINSSDADRAVLNSDEAWDERRRPT